MYRSSKQLRQPDQTLTDEEMRAVALQYVRKVSGYRAPSHADQAAFDLAIDEIAGATKTLLESLAAAGVKHR